MQKTEPAIHKSSFCVWLVLREAMRSVRKPVGIDQVRVWAGGQSPPIRSLQDQYALQCWHRAIYDDMLSLPEGQRPALCAEHEQP